MFKSKKDNKREFIKYEDGKLVSVEVDAPKKPASVIPDEELELGEFQPDKPPIEEWKEKNKKRAKKWFTWKKIKVMVSLIILILFALALRDVYQSFFSPTAKEPVETQTQAPTKTDLINQHKTTTPTTTKPSTPTSRTHSTSGKSSTPSSTPTHSSTTATPQNTPSAPVSSLSEPFQVVNEVNNNMVATASNEVQYLQSYLERKANKIGLERRINSSLTTQQNLSFYLASKKNSFKESSLKALYQATESRLLESTNFTKQMLSMVQQQEGREQMNLLVNTYLQQDEELRKKEVDAMISALKANKVPYQINEQTYEIQFTLK